MIHLLRRLRLSGKIALTGAGTALVTAVALVALAGWQSTQYNTLAQREVDGLLTRHLDHIARDIYELARTEHGAVQERVDDKLLLAKRILAALGGASLSAESVAWNAADQFTGSVVAVRLPEMLVGRRWLGQITDPASPVAVVDEVTGAAGESATIFQRMNARGDMLRVATSVRTASGQRAIGTYIPAVSADGTPNPVIAAVLNGGTFHGRAYVVNAWHITAYEPLEDTHGRLVGMVYVGFPQKTAEARVRDVVLRTEVGRTGYVYVLGGKSEERGRYIVSQHGARDGEDVWLSRDSDGQYIVQTILRTAVALGPGQLGTVRYRWRNPGDAGLRWKVARLAYFEPWDWVIGTSVYEDELLGYATLLREGRSRMTRTLALAGLIIALFTGLGGVLVARTLARPVQRMTRAVEAISRGEVPEAIPVDAHDELGGLPRAFNLMAERLGQTLEGLRKSEEDYRHLFENALEGIFRTSLDGRMLRANPGLARMLGYSSGAEMEREVTDLAHQVYAQREDRDIIVAAVLEHGSAVEQEVQFRRKDGRPIWISLNVALVRDEDGHPLWLQGFVTDITARRQAEIERASLEDQFQQAQKMESVGRLAGGVAHDFNNMLQAILGNAAWALEEMPPGSRGREYIEEIQRAAQRSADLTRQLLAFARKQTIHPRLLDLNETIAGMLRMLERLIGEDIRLHWSPGAALWPVKMDPSQVDQILANLTVNARDAIDGTGHVTIATANAMLDGGYVGGRPEWTPGDYVVLSVSDTGRGMPEEVRNHLFEPFFTTKELGKGTGLGLATVFGIVKQNGGSINVYSEPGLGTTFKLYLPRAQAEDESVQDEGRSASQPSSGTETVLLVEDEEQVLTLGRRILEHNGYTVLAAHSPDAAVEWAEHYDGPIHVLITDVVMPGMNGRELAARVTTARPDVRCLFMSGYTADVIVNRGVLDEGVEFLQKPFASQALCERVRQLLEDNGTLG
jgi:PAS domain S-box-containing protein